jgi:hypothetical protein
MLERPSRIHLDARRSNDDSESFQPIAAMLRPDGCRNLFGRCMILPGTAVKVSCGFRWIFREIR